MALAANALTTVERVEAMLDRLGRQGTQQQEADEHNLLEFLISSFSDTIQNYCERQFKPAETAVRKLFSYDGSGTLRLGNRNPPTELRSSTDPPTATSVVMYADLPTASQTTLITPSTTVAGEYGLDPSGQGSYTYVALPTTRYTTVVAITGNWGLGTVPEDVEYVCAAECANAWYRSSPILVPGEEPVAGNAGPWPLSDRSRKLLDRYIP